MNRFHFENNQILTVNDAGLVVWKGCPDEWPVAKVIELPGSEFGIVLLKYFGWDLNNGLNLVCIDVGGKIHWRAHWGKRETRPELLVDVYFDGGLCFVRSWDGNVMRIDSSTGEMTFDFFAK